MRGCEALLDLAGQARAALVFLLKAQEPLLMGFATAAAIICPVQLLLPSSLFLISICTVAIQLASSSSTKSYGNCLFVGYIFLQLCFSSQFSVVSHFFISVCPLQRSFQPRSVDCSGWHFRSVVQGASVMSLLCSVQRCSVRP